MGAYPHPSLLVLLWLQAGPSCVEAEDGEEEGREEDCCWPAGGSGVRRPMNAFFLFCKRHRSVVRERYPHLENRAITKILGEWWASLEAHEKHTYTELAKQYKEAFMKANPDFKWCKMPTLPTRSPVTRTKGATTKGADTLRWSPPDEQTNCPPRSDMPRLPTLTSASLLLLPLPLFQFRRAAGLVDRRVHAKLGECLKQLLHVLRVVLSPASRKIWDVTGTGCGLHCVDTNLQL